MVHLSIYLLAAGDGCRLFYKVGDIGSCLWVVVRDCCMILYCINHLVFLFLHDSVRYYKVD